MIRRRALPGALAACLAGAPAAGAAVFQPFDFIALGDMPYGPDLIAGPSYRHLIDLVNATGVPLTVHVGDFKDGLADCSDAEYSLQQANFQRFANALVYTPGDNDWLDCRRRNDDPLERLQALRQRFFATRQSLGQRPLAVQRQADVMPAHAAYVENLRWWHQGVLFATFHTLGPDNGTEGGAPAVRAEATRREAANAAWIRAAFEEAQRAGAPALVLVTQAEVLRYPEPIARPHWGEVAKGFAVSIANTLVPLAAATTMPVLLVHGDGHKFTIDRPFRNTRGQSIPTLWRLEVFGQPRIHAVRVRVQPSADARSPPFAFSVLWNPLSGDPRQQGRIAP